MALFGKRDSSNPAESGTGKVPLASGLRLSSSLVLGALRRVLHDAVGAYRRPPYEHTPLIYPPGYLWLSGDTHPSEVLAFDDVDKSVVTAALWAREVGTEIGLFPLGSGDERLPGLAVVREMKQLDPSLTLVGTYPPKTIALIAPRITEQFLSNLVAMAGYPARPRNLEIADAKLAGMFRIKAWEFINSRDPRTAKRFVADHENASAQRVLDDLAMWNPGVIPYIQELPHRVQGIVLEGEAASTGHFWEDMEH
jgi:hypothetical protein